MRRVGLILTLAMLSLASAASGSLAATSAPIHRAARASAPDSSPAPSTEPTPAGVPTASADGSTPSDASAPVDGSSDPSSPDTTGDAGSTTSSSTTTPSTTPTAGGPIPALPAVPLVRPKPRKPPKHSIRVEPILSGPTVPGRVARILASGRAAAPAGAPRSVKVLIWTANRLIGLHYKWGGGHGTFADRGYDCSGAVSYALHAAGLLSVPEVSGELAHWGRQGKGRWITVYANATHVWMIVAGIRLDTSSEGDPAGLSGPRWRPAERSTRRFHPRRPLA